MSELRSLIREILTQELANLHGETTQPAPRVTEEAVSLHTNADLNAFARKILAMGEDSKVRADILHGHYRFRLADTAAPQVRAHEPAVATHNPSPPVSYMNGMISERDVAALPQGTNMITAGKSVRFTPLARDELRRRNIKVERTAT